MRTITCLLILFSMMLLVISCAGGSTTPPVPTDPPTQDELDDLMGEWEGLTETSTGLLDLLHLDFFMETIYPKVTVYLNNSFVDEVYVEYDGDRISFYAVDLIGDYAEFDGYIDHDDLIYSGSFYAQMGISYRTGTFQLFKL